MESRSLKCRGFSTWDGERWSRDRISSKVFKQPILQLHLTFACVSGPKGTANPWSGSSRVWEGWGGDENVIG